MNKILRKNIASFLIVLILTIPFYVSSVFAQLNSVGTIEIAVADPVVSCLAKKQESDDFVETLDNGLIKTLETLTSTLYFTCTAWSTVRIALNTFYKSTGFCGKVNLCFLDPSCSTVASTVCYTNEFAFTTEEVIFQQLDTICRLVECKEGEIAGALGFDDSLAGIDSSIRTFTGLDPFDNIYTSIAMMCPVGILFNLRKLKTIYQTHSCCIEQACTNGISTESCERQLSEATCMFWEGSFIGSLVKIGMHLLSLLIVKRFKEEIEKILSQYSSFVKAIEFILAAFEHLKKLQEAWKWMSRTFSEPNCADLGFANIKSQITNNPSTIKCQLIQVDLNGDGLVDRIEPRCP